MMNLLTRYSPPCRLLVETLMTRIPCELSGGFGSYLWDRDSSAHLCGAIEWGKNDLPEFRTPSLCNILTNTHVRSVDAKTSSYQALFSLAPRQHLGFRALAVVRLRNCSERRRGSFNSITLTHDHPFHTSGSNLTRQAPVPCLNKPPQGWSFGTQAQVPVPSAASERNLRLRPFLPVPAHLHRDTLQDEIQGRQDAFHHSASLLFTSRCVRGYHNGSMGYVIPFPTDMGYGREPETLVCSIAYFCSLSTRVAPVVSCS